MADDAAAPRRSTRSGSDEVAGEDAFLSASKTFSSPIKLRAPDPLPPPPPMPMPAPTSSSSHNAAAVDTGSSSGAEPAQAETVHARASSGAAPVAAAAAQPVAAAGGGARPGTASTPSASSGAPGKLRVDRMLVKQAALQQTQALRAIAHRAAAEMEEWSHTIGNQQKSELLLYWGAWEGHIGRVLEANERSLVYLRTITASTAKYAETVAAARQMLEPIATGEFAVADAAGDGKGGSGGGGAGAAKNRAPTGIVMPRTARGGVLTSSVLAGNVLDLHSQLADVLSGLAHATASDALGDPDAASATGPDGKPKKDSSSSKGKGKDGAAGPPTDLTGMCAWYEAEAKEVSRIGGALASALAEAQLATSKAFEEFDSITAGHLTSASPSSAGAAGIAGPGLALAAPGAAGSKGGKGGAGGSGGAGGRQGDMWLAELQYRRTARSLLCIKHIYLQGMAGLFERYRRAEIVRTEALSRSFEAHALAVSKLFERVTARGVVDAAKSLHTHADFCGVVEAQARKSILEARRAAMASRMVTGPAAMVAQAAAAAAAAGGPGAGSYAGYPAGGAAAAAATPAAAHQAHLSSDHIHFTLDISPGVISPFASPLVVRCGMLARQVGILKVWKPHIAVLTRDCNLHFFALEVDAKASSGGSVSSGSQGAPAPALVLSKDSDDTATHPDVLQALFRPTAGGTSGHGGTQIETAATAAAAAFMPSPSASEGRNSAGGGGDEDDGSEDIADAAAAATAATLAARAKAAARKAAAAKGARLPPPALGPELLHYAAAYSTRISDLLPPSMGGSLHVPSEGKAHKEKSAAGAAAGYGLVAGSVASFLGTSGLDHALQLLRKADAAPTATIELTATTKLAFAQTQGPNVLELSDSKAGWFGSSTTTKVYLKASGPEDMLDWIVAANGLVETVLAQQQ